MYYLIFSIFQSSYYISFIYGCFFPVFLYLNLVFCILYIAIGETNGVVSKQSPTKPSGSEAGNFGKIWGRSNTMRNARKIYLGAPWYCIRWRTRTLQGGHQEGRNVPKRSVSSLKCSKTKCIGLKLFVAKCTWLVCLLKALRLKMIHNAFPYK